MQIVFGLGRQIVGMTVDRACSYAIDPLIDAPVSGSTLASLSDLNYNQVAYGAGAQAFRVIPANSDYVLTNLDVTSATLDETNKVSKVLNSNDVARILIDGGVAGAKIYEQGLSPGAGFKQVEFIDYKAGSLGAHVVNAILSAISGKSPGSTTQKYWLTNNANSSAPAASRNPSIFLPVDLSGVSAMHGNGIGAPATLISPRHYICADHYQPGNPITFQRPDGSFQTVAKTVGKRINNVDFYIGHLSAPVTGCSIFKILPDDVYTYVPSLSGPVDAQGYIVMSWLPLLFRNMYSITGKSEPSLTIFMANSQVITADPSAIKVSFSEPNGTSAIYPWQVIQALGGDSGSPAFMYVNGEPVLVSTQTKATHGSGLQPFRSQINTAMNELATSAGDPLAGTYALQSADFSMFTPY